MEGRRPLNNDKVRMSRWPRPRSANQASNREAYCDMKIKEKGLTGKAAINRKDLMSTRPRGFNAFHEMAKGDKSNSKGGKDTPKREIWLEFMGARIRVHEENGGSVKSEDVPYIQGSTLKFTGCGGTVSYKEIKVRAFPPSRTFVLNCTLLSSNLCKISSREHLTSSITTETTGA